VRPRGHKSKDSKDLNSQKEMWVANHRISGYQDLCNAHRQQTTETVESVATTALLTNSTTNCASPIDQAKSEVLPVAMKYNTTNEMKVASSAQVFKRSTIQVFKRSSNHDATTTAMQQQVQSQ